MASKTARNDSYLLSFSQKLQTLDIVLLILFLPAFIQGLRKGFTAQAIGLISVILGLWAAFKFSLVFSKWLGPQIGGSGLGVQIISFIIILILVIALLSLLGKALSGLIRIAMLGWVDRLLGFLLSSVTASLLIGALLIVFDAANATAEWISQDTLDASLLFHPLEDVVYLIFPFFKSLLGG